MKFDINSYNKYYTKPSLYPKKSLKNKISQYNWQIIIPFMFIVLCLIIMIIMQIQITNNGI